jgi:two-component system cell cycle sensor histidine kinase/response regulator CckA
MDGNPAYEGSEQKVKGSAGNTTQVRNLNLLFLRSVSYALVLVFILASGSLAGNKRVLMLNSYHKGYKWTDHLVEGIEKTLAKEVEGLELYIEYMDTKRFYSDEYLQEYLRLLLLKYGKGALDAVISSDDNAFQFLLRHHDEIFKDVPVVFCGVNHFEQSMIEGRTEFTGVVQQADIKPTIDVALKFRPDTRQIVVISDATPTGRAYQENVIKVAAKDFGGLEFVYLDGRELTHAQLLSKLPEISDRSTVLMTLWLKDKNGFFIPWSKGMPAISANSPAPIYGVVEGPLPYGIVGGKIQSGWYQGQKAAEIVSRILVGKEKPKDIPVDLTSPNKYIFNYSQLKRWKISEDKLPKGSVILEKPVSFYSRYKYHFWTALFIFVLMTCSIIVLSFNIIKLKKTEAALRESEEKYKTLTENSLTGIFIHQDGRFVFVNDRFAGIHGYTAQEMLGMEYLLTVHPDYRDQVKEKVSQRLAGKIGAGCYELHTLRKDGTGFWSELMVVSIKYGGKPAIMGNFIDITDRRQAEEALRAAEETYRNLFMNSQIGLFRTDLESGLILDANDRVAQFIGYKDRNELMAKPFNIAERYVDHEDRKSIPALLKEHGEFRNYEARFRRNNGSEIWMRYSARLVPDKGWLEGVSEDITKEKQSEEALRKSEERYRAILEGIEEGYYETDIAGNVVFFNDSLCRIFGYPADELRGMSYGQNTTKDTADRIYQVFNGIYRTGKPVRGFEHDILLKDGKVRHIEVSASSLKNEEGKVIGFRGITRDVTERRSAEEEKRRLEAQLQQARKMEAVGLLAGGVAHDLNNILCGIVGYPDLLLLELEAGSPLRKSIEIIKDSGIRASDVVEDLLTVARGAVISKEALNLKSTVEEYLSSAEHRKLERTCPAVRFRAKLDPGLLNINASPIHVKKALMNLVINATEAVEDEGTVTLSAMNRYLDKPLKGYEDVRMGEYCVLSVSDDGSGISPEDLERIFEPFYTKKIMGRSGTGLGLTVVWNVVKDHDGYMEVKTGKRGTVFEMYFPVTRAEATAREEEVLLEDYLGHGERVLVVDDEQRQREIACRLLTKLGYQVDAVSSGEEAIEYLKEKSVDLIVLDMIMPKGMNGRKTYEEIVKTRPGQKAIIASGFSKTQDVKAAQSLGAGKYMKKPYTLKKIGIAVKKELEK